jgi:hypothetical protein
VGLTDEEMVWIRRTIVVDEWWVSGEVGRMPVLVERAVGL